MAKYRPRNIPERKIEMVPGDNGGFVPQSAIELIETTWLAPSAHDPKGRFLTRFPKCIMPLCRWDVYDQFLKITNSRDTTLRLLAVLDELEPQLMDDFRIRACTHLQEEEDANTA